MKLENLEFYGENEEDFSEILYQSRKKYYKQVEDYFILEIQNEVCVVYVYLVYKITPGEYSSFSESPDDYFGQTELVAWDIKEIHRGFDIESWKHEDFIKTLDKEEMMCFNSELKKFIDQQS